MAEKLLAGRWDRLLATHIPLVEDHDAIHLAMNSSSDPDVGHPINGIPRIMAISIPD